MSIYQVWQGAPSTNSVAPQQHKSRSEGQAEEREAMAAVAICGVNEKSKEQVRMIKTHQ